LRARNVERENAIASQAHVAGPHLIRVSGGQTERAERPHAAQPKVAVLLCTLHGQTFLAEQLDSIERQEYAHWDIWASDDGSRDRTHDILKDYQVRWGKERLTIHSGPAEGFVANFLSLTCRAGIQADYYAYADQDDIWQPDKLSRALQCLQNVPAGIPALYCSRTRLVDATGGHLGYSPLFKRPPSFRNALVQSVGGGNTMVFNDATRRLLQEAGDDVAVASHDWWAYLVVTGCGGHVYYDAYPGVHYRQHECNMVGANQSWAARWKRLMILLDGRFKKWTDLNTAALQRIRVRLTPENRAVFDTFCEARKRSLIPRLIGVLRSGVYRQRSINNLSLLVAALIDRL
jgi:glycosyltransferase involved in cell wall biosynthesis